MGDAAIMEKTKEKDNSELKQICKRGHIKLSVHFHNIDCQLKYRATDSLRTYATWLVRATRRKMAASGPQNTPKNDVELT